MNSKRVYYLGEAPGVGNEFADVYADFPAAEMPESMRSLLRGDAPASDTLVDVTCAICGEVLGRMPKGTYHDDPTLKLHHLCPKHTPAEQAAYIKEHV